MMQLSPTVRTLSGVMFLLYPDFSDNRHTHKEPRTAAAEPYTHSYILLIIWVVKDAPTTAPHFYSERHAAASIALRLPSVRRLSMYADVQYMRDNT